MTVTGEDGPDIDGNVVYTIVTNRATSADTNYSGLDPNDVGVFITDNDS